MYYFASDMHLGLGSRESSLERERLLISWLEEVSADARAIFLVGDVFDFWYEYRRVIPKGFSRLLGTLSSLADRGVEIHFFPGNHDMWSYDYLSTECGVNIHHHEQIMELYGRKLYIAHGDDITSRYTASARFMNFMFRSPPVRWVFSHLFHPDAVLRFGQRWSASSRKSKEVSHDFLGEEDYMVRFAREYLSKGEMVDFFIFGHNHCAEVYPLDGQTTVVFLGEWIEKPSYAALSPDGKITLKRVSAS